MARSADDVTPRDVVRAGCRLRCTARVRILAATPGRPGASSVIRGEEEEVDCKEERARLDRAARVRAGARRGRLRWGRWRWRSGGASVVVLYGDRVRGRRGPGLHPGLGLPAPGLVADADRADRRCDQVPAAAAGVEGRRLQHRLPVVRRRDRAGGQVGLGQVLGERQRLRGERRRHRRHRDVQLRVRRHRDPGSEPGSRRWDPDDVAGEHVRLPHGSGAVVRLDRAGQVLPVRVAELPARRRERRVPGCRGRGVRPEPGHQEHLHPERQGGLRPRRRDELP